jgi:hypothetical protein
MSKKSIEVLVQSEPPIKPLTASILRALLSLPLGAQAKELAVLLNCDVEQVRRALRAAKAKALVDVEPGDRMGPAEWFLLPAGRETLREYERMDPPPIAPAQHRLPPSLPNVPNSVFALGNFAN